MTKGWTKIKVNSDRRKKPCPKKVNLKVILNNGKRLVNRDKFDITHKIVDHYNLMTLRETYDTNSRRFPFDEHGRIILKGPFSEGEYVLFHRDAGYNTKGYLRVAGTNEKEAREELRKEALKFFEGEKHIFYCNRRAHIHEYSKGLRAGKHYSDFKMIRIKNKEEFISGNLERGLLESGEYYNEGLGLICIGLPYHNSIIWGD